jgi:hypothetical protein
MAGGVHEQGVALQRADVLALLGERRVGLALEFFEVSHRPSRARLIVRATG